MANAQPAGDSPYKFNPLLDGVLLGGGILLWEAPSLLIPQDSGHSSCDPCNPNDLNALDRAALGPHYVAARTAANAYFASSALFLVFDIVDAGPKNWRSYLTDFGVVAEAIAWDGVAQQLISHAVRRSRPYLYIPGAYQSERNTLEATASFYSGHASSMFTLGTAFALTYTLRHPHSRWTPLVWVASLTIAAVEPTLRVFSGEHFVSDVLVGSAVGTAFGLVIPTLHRVPLVHHARLVPNASSTTAGVSLVSAF